MICSSLKYDSWPYFHVKYVINKWDVELSLELYYKGASVVL